MERAFNRHFLSVIAGLFLFTAVLTGCEDSGLVDHEAAVGEESPLADDAASKKGSAAGLATGTITTVASFDAFSGELPEGIAVDHSGNIYVSMSGLGEIWKLDADGSFEEIVASFTLNPGDLGVLGLRFDPRGDLYAAVNSTDMDAHGIWKITSSGARERLAGTSSIIFPNDVTVSPRGTVYISDSATGALWRVRSGESAQIWIQDETLEGTGAFGLGVPIGANGIVVVPGQKMPFARHADQPSVGGLLVANSEKAQVVYVPILPDGSAGDPTVVVADPSALFGLDGLTVDARGTMYGAVNVANTIVRISRNGSDIDEVASGEPLDFPAGLTFGTGRDQHTLFIANFAIIHFLSDPPTPGDANPAVISIRVGPPGRAR